MIYSMTGFSALTRSITYKREHLQVTMTLKTLNSRYLEAINKLPFALTHLETECLKKFKQRLIRGNVYFAIQLANPSALKAHIAPAMSVIEGYCQAVDQIRTTTNITGDFVLRDLLTLPHVFEVPEELVDQEASQQLLKAIDELIDAVMTVRFEEGSVLQKDLAERIKKARENVLELESKIDLVLAQRREHLMNSMQPFLQVAAPETKDLQLQQLYNQLDKMDIHEEMVRFKAHLDTFEKLLTSQETEKGKRLDFTLQELFREISTAMAKCPSAEISSLGISIKIELEKAREQVQNIL